MKWGRRFCEESGKICKVYNPPAITDPTSAYFRRREKVARSRVYEIVVPARLERLKSC
jgi:hypothetical protein